LFPAASHWKEKKGAKEIMQLKDETGVWMHDLTLIEHKSIQQFQCRFSTGPREFNHNTSLNLQQVVLVANNEQLLLSTSDVEIKDILF